MLGKDISFTIRKIQNEIFIPVNKKLKLSRNTLQEYEDHDSTKLENGLPIVTLLCTYQEKTIELKNVWFDTGCASTIFDTDLLANIGLYLDLINGTAKRMYGVGGASELC